MRTLLIAAVIGTLACTSAAPAASSGAMDGLIEQFMSSSVKAFTSGTASMIRGVYKKAIREDEVLTGKTFTNERQKKGYLSRLRLDLTAKEDRMTHTFERLYFDGEQKRRDSANCSPATVATLRENPQAADDLAFQVITYNPESMVSRVNLDLNGRTRKYARIKSGEIYFPSFASFGRPEDDQAKLSDKFAQIIDAGRGEISRSEVDGKIHLEFSMGSDRRGKFRIERIFDPDKDMALLYEATTKEGTLARESIFSDYTQLEDGQWYPLKATFNRYARLNGQNTVVSAETFETIAGTVQFDKPIDPIVFSPPFEDGTNVIDFRFNPPLTFRVDSPDVEFVPEAFDADTSLAAGHGAGITKILLPIIDPNGRLPIPFVLDLASGKLILPHAQNAKITRRAENLIKLRRGDLAWDGALLLLRKSQLVSPTGAAGSLYDCIEREWCEACTLPADIALPYSFTVRTHEMEKYRVTIHEIIETGIWLSHQKTDAL